MIIDRNNGGIYNIELSGSKQLKVFYMRNVLIIGGGIAGCTASAMLSEAGIRSVVLESSSRLGGKVRDYGCKADSKCNQCGVCLAGDLWDRVGSDANISSYLGSRLLDLQKNSEGFEASFISQSGVHKVQVTDVIVASGYSDYAEHTRGAIEMPSSPRILGGGDMERLLKNRTPDGIFEGAPRSVGFVTCYGSRDVKEKAQYCSRVCCAYSTRMAKVIKHYYPDTEITMFFMDLQTVNASPRYMDELTEAGIVFERCRPAGISLEEGFPVVAYEDSDGFRKKAFDYVVLCGGIHPTEDAVSIADITGLGVDENGFLRYVVPPEKSRVFLAGCVSGPKNIRESVAEARNVAARIIGLTSEDGMRQ
jgi:heterodisulfide reductase subunit A